MPHTTNSARRARSIAVAIVLGVLGAMGVLFGGGPRGVPTASASTGARATAIRIDQGGVPRISVDLAHLADDALRARLASGLTQTLVTRVDAYEASAPAVVVGSARHACRVRYDAWERRFEARVVTREATSEHVVISLDAVIDVCLDLHDLAIGAPSDWTLGAVARASFVASVALNPLSRETAQRIHLWLEHGPDAHAGTTFFGPFVNLFVDRRVQDAERELGSEQ